MLIKEKLPSVEEYYKSQRVNLMGDGVWKLGFCFFCRNPLKTRTLNVHMLRGRYLCTHCGTEGSDFLHYHQQKYGLCFPRAAKCLGAWGADK